MPHSMCKLARSAPFATYCYIALASVAAFQMLSTQPVLARAFLIVGPPIASSIIRNAMFTRETRPPSYYCMPLSIVLVMLGKAAIFIQKHINAAIDTGSPDGSRLYASFVHFEIAFVVLFVCEVYRLYFDARGSRFSVSALLENDPYMRREFKTQKAEVLPPVTSARDRVCEHCHRHLVGLQQTRSNSF